VTAGSRRLTPRRAQKLFPQPETEVPMKQQQQPQPTLPPNGPPVVVSDTTLAVLWLPHREAIERAKAAASLAAPLEKSATSMWADAKLKRENADNLIAEAAELEAAARKAEQDAQGHRQDEDFHAETAQQIADTVAFLVGTNRKMHPAEKAERDRQIAAANAAAQPNPLTASVGTASPQPAPHPDDTAPFAAAGEAL
jgi:hypothetical protein